MPSKDIVVDADGHILEPPDLWEKYLEEKYQPHAIKVVRNEKGLECLQYDGKLSVMAQPGFLAALGGMGKEQDQLRPDAERTYVGSAPFGSMDAKERVELLDRENLAKAVLYPTLGILWEAEVEDVELSQAYCRAYNRWIADFCRPYSDRLIPIAHLSLGDPQAAAIELERAVKDGCRGAFVAPFTITRKPHGHPDHDAVFAMCEKLDVPFAIHPTFEPKGLNRARFHGMDRMPLMGVIASHMLQQPLSTFFQFGTFDKFPKLRVVVLESGSSWLGFWMDRMDEGFETWMAALSRSSTSRASTCASRCGSRRPRRAGDRVRGRLCGSRPLLLGQRLPASGSRRQVPRRAGADGGADVARGAPRRGRTKRPRLLQTVGSGDAGK